MKKWVYKTLAITVAFLTFGIITPNHEIWTSLEQLDNQKKAVIYEPSTNDVADSYQLDELIEQPENPLASILTNAKEQSYIKFGTKISPVIGEEFETIIYPKMAEAIEMTLAQLDDKTIKQIAITESPSGDYSEKIFNIYNIENRKDLMRFHVRTENRPFEGHYYNFHYHLNADQFATHYNLGEIYWSKNTPPKWMS
jgi:hypothetical protein